MGNVQRSRKHIGGDAAGQGRWRHGTWVGPTAIMAGLVLGALQFWSPARPALGDATPAPVAADPTAAEFFETNVRPVLATACYGCHGPDAQMGGLRLDSRAALLQGGKTGPSVVPGDPARSLLIKAVEQTGTLKMPLGGHLKSSEIEALSTWVKMGAPWPDAKVEAGSYVITPAQRKFWSFQPVRTPPLPAVKHSAWVKTPVDRFVLARLEARGLAPAPPTDRRTLIRRVTYDLTGLPPTPAEVSAFLADRSPDAYAKVVDRLLASPRYGESWARHWLDVARYADTKGYVFNEDRNYPNAYTYRDWVIHAFNRDMPYDEFIKEQIAADRMPTRETDPRSLAALGFLTVGRRFLNQDPDIINDRIDVVTRGFEGLTVACARCHDHKFDPIPTKDYYSLYGVFASSQEKALPISPRAVSAAYGAYDTNLTGLDQQEQQLVLAQVAALRERLKKGDASLTAPVHEALQATSEGDRPQPDNLSKLEPFFTPEARATLKSLREQAAALRRQTPPAKPEFAMALEDAPAPVHQHIFKRGNPDNQGDEAPPRFLQILSPPNRPIWDHGSGRLELAQAIASKTNPLTARVFVNRVWLYHFGKGLVRTPSDFGKQGERPTDPALLDYLASTFMSHGWSVKKLQRLVVLSATYRQSDENPDPRLALADPDNRLLGHMNRRRLEFEAVRDSLLCASGALDTRTVGGPSVDLWSRPYPTRRTLYGFIERQNLPGIFRTFDLASPDTTSPQRFVTTVPQQALFFLNSPFVAEQARALAARPEFLARDEAGRVRYLYGRLFGRPASAEEVALGLRYVHSASLPPPRSEAPLWQYGYGRYDDLTKRVAGFTPLARFDERGWHGGAEFPDPQLHFLLLTADGGHPGADSGHAVIRRWTAPRSGAVAIHGVLRHGQEQGDGVRGRVVSSRAGLLGEWTVHHGEAATDAPDTFVEKGDTLDFVVDCRDSDAFDSFGWAPVVRLTSGVQSWDAQAEFHGPDEALRPMGAWARYVQALLMTNEFVFVD